MKGVGRKIFSETLRPGGTIRSSELTFCEVMMEGVGVVGANTQSYREWNVQSENCRKHCDDIISVPHSFA